MALSPKVIDTITQAGRYSDKHGLYLKVTPSGSKSWIFRYQFEGERHDAGLGSYPAVSLTDARKAAIAMRASLDRGIDPLKEKRQQAIEAITFEQEALEFIDRHRAGWSQKHASQWENSMRDHVFAIMGRKAVSSIETADVVAVLDPIWSDKPETARRVRNRIWRVLEFSKAQGHRDGDNPAKWQGHIQNIMGRRRDEVKQLDSMPYYQLPNFMRELDSVGTRQALCLQFVILTACRSSEAMGAKWDEIDFANKVWTIPAERMKNAKPHQIPLSDAAMTVLSEVRTRGKSDLIFPNKRLNGELASNALRRLLAQLTSDCTVHGFRATFRTWADEKTNFAFDVCEKALSHAVGNATSRAYTRGSQLEKRRALMERWARFAMERITPEAKETRPFSNASVMASIVF